MLDLNLLRTLVVLKEKRNLKLAGVKLGITESAVSKQLTRLREQLDDMLFERTTNGLEPTDYTLAILPTVEQAIRNIDNLASPTSFTPEHFKKTLTIAMPAALLEHRGIVIYNHLVNALPNAEVKLITWEHNSQRAIATRELDAGLHFWSDERSADIHQQVVCEDLLVVSVAKTQNVQWEDVKNWPFLRLNVHGWSEYRRIYVEYSQRSAVEFDYKLETDNLAFAKKLLLQGKVASVLPQSLLGEDLKKVVTPNGLEMPVKWVLNTNVANRSTPIHKVVHRAITAAFKESMESNA